jgi:hypothetical protein
MAHERTRRTLSETFPGEKLRSTFSPTHIRPLVVSGAAMRSAQHAGFRDQAALAPKISDNRCPANGGL